MSDNRSGDDRAGLDGGDHGTSTLPEDTIDEVCRALGDRHRRGILGYLIETENGVATLDELLDPVEPLSPHNRRRLRIALQHNHLVLLDQVGIIEYDRRSHTARYYGNRLAEELLGRTVTVSTHDYQSLADSPTE